MGARGGDCINTVFLKCDRFQDDCRIAKYFCARWFTARGWFSTGSDAHGSSMLFLRALLGILVPVPSFLHALEVVVRVRETAD